MKERRGGGVAVAVVEGADGCGRIRNLAERAERADWNLPA